MKRNKSKLNRYGKALGVAVIGGQVFKEKLKKYTWEKPLKSELQHERMEDKHE